MPVERAVVEVLPAERGTLRLTVAGVPLAGWGGLQAEAREAGFVAVSLFFGHCFVDLGAASWREELRRGRSKVKQCGVWGRP